MEVLGNLTKFNRIRSCAEMCTSSSKQKQSFLGVVGTALMVIVVVVSATFLVLLRLLLLLLIQAHVAATVVLKDRGR